MKMSEIEYRVTPIGKIVKDVTGNHLEISEEYRDGLLELENYSHIHVYWWAHELDSQAHREVLITDIPYSKEKTRAGVFACRSPERPNLVMDTVCKMRGINKAKGKIFIENIDAMPDTPIIDLKPYIPCVDRVKQSRVPRWFPEDWGEWVPDKGIF
jgi:tRNA-Thr(GGU) m(6)t(6)A37 methyltransferase TsaA